ncbi:uncharacterized protein LOC131165997 [Malania oleifera]|uniref:uncharacterized protein LOC131165997 n=1 Tax=Malania oleifera TaxID=397392 RepID=UPI0025AECBD1|nr:uncharacterized protein LOC131165997 [Malania oleifera]
MVVKMMKWRPWPPLSAKKFEAKLVVRRLKGLCLAQSEGEKASEDFTRLVVETKWKGPNKNVGLGSLRKRTKRNFTKEVGVGEDGIAEWNEDFRNICNLSVCKEGVFHPWEVAFTIFNGLNKGSKDKAAVVGTASLDLAEFASAAKEKELEINVHLVLSDGSRECGPSLCLSLSLLELRAAHELSELVQRSIESVPLSPRSADALRAGLRKVKKLTDYVSAPKTKKTCQEEESSDDRSTPRVEDSDCCYPFDTDSVDDFDEGELEEGKEDSSVWLSFNYGKLAYANGGSFYSNTVVGGEHEDWLYYSSNRKLDAGCLLVENSTELVPPQSFQRNSKRSILSWRKRKLSFKASKGKGEPLLKSYYGEEGGDDIDFDRRQLSSSEESLFGSKSGDLNGNRSSVSEFGDDNFTVGSWEQKEVISRDGRMKLQAQVFFASIDQRSERASGESACTALVAVLADWFQYNRNEMPIKSQFDSLIREGSLEWRKLCENDAYKDRFLDKHFDLETVLEAKIRPLTVAPEKSFIGFFHPDGLEEGNFDFLHSAMSFDSIWDEMSRYESTSNGDPLVYIVSWNDHFFVLKVEKDAYSIIDTLGERFYEGCNQAYILKFDKDTIIHQLPNSNEAASEEKPARDKVQLDKPKEVSAEKKLMDNQNEAGKDESEDAVLCRGKESCKEYIKSFLAAIPVRELQVDIKKGLMASTPLHHRLQIEFHYTQGLHPVVEYFTAQQTLDLPETAALALA